mmetsp:Transcript_13518/g.25427  ORF Transcript_13518/g.25427 Transcript_13518/m.25427 type:complete len:212 (-) Transcript_13518:3839-4474(-)
MGCKGSVLFSRREEDNIDFHEQDLGFSFNYCEHIDFVIRKYSTSDSINLQSWKLVVESLHLKFPKPDKLHLEDFYSCYITAGCIRTRDLLATGLMLGDGSDLEIARLLFELSDHDSHKVLSKSQVTNLIGLLLKQSLHHLPLLASEPTPYTRNIQSVEADAIEKLTACLMESSEEIDKEQFIEKLTTTEARAVLRPSRVRGYCYALSALKS